jgi:probable rRNA maturation factor
VESDDGLLSEQEIVALSTALETVVESDIPLAVEFLRVDETEIRRLNAETRGIDKVTDVLSYPTMDDIKGEKLFAKDHPFEVDENGNLLIGSVVVCEKRAREQAEEYGHDYARELHYLLVHGVLHCLGYDHIEETDKAEMRALEENVLGALGITRGE